MCEYCTTNETEHKAIINIKYESLGLDIIKNKLYVSSETYHQEPDCWTGWYERTDYNDIEINFCPMCGNKLIGGN